MINDPRLKQKFPVNGTLLKLIKIFNLRKEYKI